MTSQREYFLYDAIHAKQTDTALQLLSEGIDIEAKYEDGTTPLIWAARAGDVELVRKLIDLGANLDIRDQFGRDAISVAYYYGEVSMGNYSDQALRIAKMLKLAIQEKKT